MKIAALAKFRGRNPKGFFRDLSDQQRHDAYQWLHRFVTRWGYDLPPWRFAILVGQAKRLAMNPPSSQWGRTMLARRGGLAVQKRYRIEGRRPTERATEMRLAGKRRAEAANKAPESQKMRVVHLRLWD